MFRKVILKPFLFGIEPGAKLKGGMGSDSHPPSQIPISQSTGEVCRAKMSNLTCENRNTIAKYYFVTD